MLPFLWLGAVLAAIVGFFAILVTGKFPSDLFEFVVGVQRWTARVFSYGLLLSDEYPPYSISAEARPAGRLTLGLSGLVGLGVAAIVALAVLGISALWWVTEDWDDVSLQHCSPLGPATPAEVYAGYGFGTIQLNQSDQVPSTVTYVVAVSQSQGPQDLDTSDFELVTTSGSTRGPSAAFIGGDDSEPVTTLLFQLDAGSSPEELQYDPGIFSRSQTLSLTGECT